jgi:hypothetical protein
MRSRKRNASCAPAVRARFGIVGAWRYENAKLGISFGALKERHVSEQALLDLGVVRLVPGERDDLPIEAQRIEPPMSNISGSASNLATTSWVQRRLGLVSAKKSFRRA